MNPDERKLECENEERMINDDEVANLRLIFDRDRIIETDEDLLKLAELVEDEDEKETF